MALARCQLLTLQPALALRPLLGHMLEALLPLQHLLCKMQRQSLVNQAVRRMQGTLTWLLTTPTTSPSPKKSCRTNSVRAVIKKT